MNVELSQSLSFNVSIDDFVDGKQENKPCNFSRILEFFLVNMLNDYQFRAFLLKSLVQASY